MFRPNEIVIDDTNYVEHVGIQVIDGEPKGYGLVPRDYSANPLGSYASVVKFNMPLIPRNEWSSRIKDMVQSESRLSDIRLTGNNGQSIPSTDQGNRGYCWAHSPVSCMLVNRAVANLPYERLSAYAIACIIKNYRDQGGWNPQALEFIISRGCPTVEFWPEKSTSPANDNPRTWANAAKHKVTEGWMDLVPAAYDRNLSFDQMMTCLLSRIPVAADLMWWLHSVAFLDPIEYDNSLSLMDPNRWGVRFWNSWRDAYGDRGMNLLRGNKAIPDGATATKITT